MKCLGLLAVYLEVGICISALEHRTKLKFRNQLHPTLVSEILWLNDFVLLGGIESIRVSLV